MKRIKSKLLLSLLGTSLSIGIGISINSNINNDVAPTYAAVGDYSTDASTYYQNITATSGKPLAGQLHDLITSTHRTYTTYDDNKIGYQKETDRYYENGSSVKGYIYEFYSGVKWPDGWNSNAGNTNADITGNMSGVSLIVLDYGARLAVEPICIISDHPKQD